MRYPLLSTLLLLLTPPALAAQSDGGSDILSGRVTDLTGRPLSEAQVSVLSARTGLTRLRMTDDDGRYRIVFPENAPQYMVTVKRLGFAPVQRTINRRSATSEAMTIDFQLGGTPLALSMVEITGDQHRPLPREQDKATPADAAVPNPIAEILAIKDSLHLSAVQIVGLGYLSDTLYARNTAVLNRIRSLLRNQKEISDPSEVAGSVALMLQEAARNTDHAVAEAEKLLRPEQWAFVPAGIRERISGTSSASAKQENKSN